jgi:hypothetical protein
MERGKPPATDVVVELEAPSGVVSYGSDEQADERTVWID